MQRFSRLSLAQRPARLTFFVCAVVPSVLANVVFAQLDPVAPALSMSSDMVNGMSVPLTFNSVLSRYKPMTDQKLGSWRDANDTVARIGGWRSYLKESQAPDTAVPATPPTSSAPAAAAPATLIPHVSHGAKP